MPEARTKLLFVCGSLAGGGAEKILVYLVNHMDRERYERRLVILERKLDYLRELDASVPMDCLDQTPRWGLVRVLFRLRRLLRAQRPDVVLAVLNYVNLVTLLAKLISGVRTRVILCEHISLKNYFPSNLFGRIKLWLMRATFGLADAVVCVSAGMRREMIEEHGLAPGLVRLIYNPIPLDEIVGKSRAEVGHPFFAPGRFKVVISAGRLVRQKRFDRLLRAFARAREQRPDLRLIVLGKGELEADLMGTAKALGVAQDVEFAGFQSNPYAWMARATMFAMSSEREGFPNVLIEAMACGLPVVSTDCATGPGEIIEHGRNGLLVPEEPIEPLADAILRLAEDDDLRAKFSEAGKRFAEQFRVEKVLPLYERLFTNEPPKNGRP